jgi:peptidoglycan hydrolase-like protein with peptidoglycan-binding domain
VAAVQSTLKERQFYFGEVTGKIDPETRAAVRRFQVHRGLPMTGEIDNATMQSLQSASSETESRSIRGKAQETAQDDKEFLQNLEANERTAPPASIPSRPRTESATTTQQPPPRRTPAENPPRSEVSRALMSSEDADKFVRDYISAAEQPTPAREVSFYADQVSYFEDGLVNRRFVEKDQRNYYRRWPSRKFTLLGPPEIVQATEERVSLRFRIHYEVHGPEGTAEGETENILKVRQTAAGPRIVGIRERKVPQQ